MNITWKINAKDARRAKAFYAQHRNNPFVENRYRRNVANPCSRFVRKTFFKRMVICLLTTQQRSGPNSHVHQLIMTTPFPIEYEYCRKATNLERHIAMILRKRGGIRRVESIAREVTHNLDLLESGLWDDIRELAISLGPNTTAEKERETATFIHDHFKGFGPKQSRNLLQTMGLSKYEIPIDSRITKWLNNFGFPIELSSTALSDRGYYELVSDGIQALCKKADILPCMLDAAIFSSYDGDAWTETNVLE